MVASPPRLKVEKLVFDRTLFSPETIIPFENWDTGKLIFLDINQEKFFGNLSSVCGNWGNYHIIYNCR